MDPRKSKHVKYLDDDSTSKTKPNRSKNKSKSKKQFDKNLVTSSSSISLSNSQFQNTHVFESANSSSSIKSSVDKKKSSHNKKSNNPSKNPKQYVSPKESKSRQTNLESQISSVLLGFPDGNISVQEDNDPYTTKIGGKPNWFRDSHPLSHDVIICKNCDKDMFLLFQGYVPLEDSVYDRVIYIFGCNQQKCMNKNGSFRAFRAHRKDEEYERRYQQECKNKHRSSNTNNNQPLNVMDGGLGDMLFGVIDYDDMQISEKEMVGKEEVVANDENDENEVENNHEDDEWPELDIKIINSKVSNATSWKTSWSRVISDAEKARNEKDQVNDQVSSKRENNDDNISQIAIDMSFLTLKTNWPENIKSFPAQYLYITEEILEEKMNDDIFAKYYEEAQDLLDRSQENEDNSDWFGEKYEKSILPKGYDKTFKKFSDRVAEWPDQCVRYQFDGQPLLYTHNDVTAKLLLQKDNCNDKITSSKLPVCRWCGSTRVFELQLMPSMLSTLSTSSYIDEEVNSDKKNDNSIFNLGMEWGTIMVFTCKNDCEKIGVGFDEVSYYEEVVMVQYEQ